MKLKIDTYTIYARFFPCIISALPLFILWFFLSKDVQVKELGSFLFSLKFYGSLTLSVVFLYFYAQILRIVSKFIQNNYFRSKGGFPTMYLLTYVDQTFSKSYKDKYRKLVKKHFDINLLNESEESADISESRRRLNEATKQVILKVKDGQLVKKQNMWYGFIRNLIGGAFFSILFCVFNIVIALLFKRNAILLVSSFILIILYLTVFIFRKQMLRQNAEAYANQLIAEFFALG